MPPLGTVISPKGVKVYTEVTCTFPAPQPGQTPPAALYEFAQRLVEYALAARPETPAQEREKELSQ